MKVGVLADTHLSSLVGCVELGERLLSGPFADVAAVLHAGDQVHPGLGNYFYPLPWYAVRGNMDPHECPDPVRRIITLAGWRIALMHGWGPSRNLEKRIMSCFPEQPDVLVYGHSHQPCCHYEGSLLIFNPGSPTQRRRAPRHSVGILHLDQEIRGEILFLD